MLDRRGKQLAPGDVVKVIKIGSPGFHGVVKGRLELHGNEIEKRIVRARVEQLGFRVSEIVELRNGSWVPLRFVEKVETAFEPAEMGFNQLLESLKA